LASIYALKGRFQSLLRPLAGRLHAAGVTANAVTLTALVGSIVVGGVVWCGAPAKPLLYLLLPLWLFVRMALNAIDGMLAREFGQQSKLGAYLNELCDVVADTALYLSLAAVPDVPAWLPWLLVAVAALTEYAGVLGVMVGAQRRYDGPMGKSDRAFVVGAIGLLLAPGWIEGGAVTGVLAAMCVLCGWTVLRRIRAGLAQATGTAAR
jgi:CDP-diacylglycerol--glycerol-3-phosphate 3-phosphatidyltransferase